MGYYDPLRDYLMGCHSDEVALTFAEVEAILERALPTSARKYDAWWANLGDDVSTRHSHARSWHDAGYRARANRTAGTVVFRRADPPGSAGLSPAGIPDDGHTIALIACAKQKEAYPCPARELYAPSTRSACPIVTRRPVPSGFTYSPRSTAWWTRMPYSSPTTRR